MAHFKKNVYQHLHSAKGWLTKAEEAFDKEKDIRGELDLMLAQAELQHVKEANRGKHWRYKYAFVRHGAALTCAVLIAAGLGGFFWWTQKQEVAAVTPPSVPFVLPLDAKKGLENNAVQATPAGEEHMKKKLVPKVKTLPMPKEETLPVQHTATEKISRQQSKEEPLQQPEPPAAVSSDEMQKLVRAAGKSLRGQ